MKVVADKTDETTKTIKKTVPHDTNRTLKMLVLITAVFGIFFQVLCGLLFNFHNNPIFEGAIPEIMDKINAGLSTQLTMTSYTFYFLSSISTTCIAFLLIYTGTQKQKYIATTILGLSAVVFYTVFPDWFMDDLQPAVFYCTLMPLLSSTFFAAFLKQRVSKAAPIPKAAIASDQ